MLTSYVEEGKSSTSITRELNDKGIPAAMGGYWVHGSVQKVLRNAKTYAGVHMWDGIEVQDFVEEPVISLALASQIEQRRKNNKALSSGGRRMWLTGRVFTPCGLRYNLAQGRGARCNKNRSTYPEDQRCGCARIGLKLLEGV